MPSSHLRSALLRILLAAAPLAVHADFALVVPEREIHSEQSVTLQAFHSHGKRANWRWSLVEADGGTLTPGPGDTAVYQAPRTLVPRQVHVRVFDEADPLVDGRNLYISDTGNRALRVFDLDYRTLHTLCGGPDAGSELRLGPLAYYQENKSQEGQAVIPFCHSMTFSATGTLVAAHGDALVQLEAMPRFVSPARSAAEDKGVVPERKDR